MADSFSQKQFWLIVFVAVFPWLMHGQEWLEILVTQVDHCPQLGCDFTRHYFPQVQFMSQGARIFQTGWFYPPLLAIVLRPLVFVQDPLLVWTGIQFLLMGVLAFLMVRRMTFQRTWQSWVCAIALVSSSFPVIHSVKWGQVSLLIGVGLIFVFFELREKVYKAAILLGFLGGLKLYPIYFLLIYLLEKRLKPFFLASGTFVFFAAGFPIFMIGLEATQHYYLRVQGGMVAVKMMASSAGGQSLGVSAFRWFQDATHVNTQTPIETALLVDSQALYMLCLLGGSMMLLGLILSALRRGFSWERTAALIILGVHLVVSPGWHHYFAFVPFLWLIAWNGAGKWGRIILCLVFLLERLPMFTLGLVDDSYHWYSVSGCTTIVALSIFFVLRFSEKSATV